MLTIILNIKRFLSRDKNIYKCFIDFCNTYKYYIVNIFLITFLSLIALISICFSKINKYKNIIKRLGSQIKKNKNKISK